MSGYKPKDWRKMCRGLDRAQAAVQKARTQNDRDELDVAVLSVWQFGEYAVNVVLELVGKKADEHHQHPARVEELKAGGHLKGDYREILEQLNRYRKRAAYAGYSSEPSVHYSPRNVEDCLKAMRALQDEVEQALRQRGKLR